MGQALHQAESLAKSKQTSGVLCNPDTTTRDVRAASLEMHFEVPPPPKGTEWLAFCPNRLREMLPNIDSHVPDDRSWRDRFLRPLEVPRQRGSDIGFMQRHGDGFAFDIAGWWSGQSGAIQSFDALFCDMAELRDSKIRWWKMQLWVYLLHEPGFIAQVGLTSYFWGGLSFDGKAMGQRRLSIVKERACLPGAHIHRPTGAFAVEASAIVRDAESGCGKQIDEHMFGDASEGLNNKINDGERKP